MDFFTKLASSGLKDATIGIKVDSNGIMTIAMSTKTTSEVKEINALRPLILTGTTQELDEGFFNVILAPIENTQKVYNNAEAYELDVKNAAKAAENAKKAKAEAAEKKVADKKAKAKSEVPIEFEAPTTETSTEENIKTEEVVETDSPIIKEEQVPVPTAPVSDFVQNETPVVVEQEEAVIPPPPPAPIAETKAVKPSEDKKLDKKAAAILEAEEALRAHVEHPEYDPSKNTWVPVPLYGKLLDLDPDNEYGLSVKSAFRKWKLNYKG